MGLSSTASASPSNPLANDLLYEITDVFNVSIQVIGFLAGKLCLDGAVLVDQFLVCPFFDRIIVLLGANRVQS